MDRFNSLDALVAESKKKFHMLIKFGSLENLERFQSGSLYMKNLRFYNELECEPGNGKPDKYDGKWKMNGGQFVLIDPSTSTLVASGTARETIFSFGYEKYPVFCLFCQGCRLFYLLVTCAADHLIASSSSIQTRLHASLGILRSPRGDTATEPTFGPSGRQDRLNCWEKNLL